MIAFETHEAVLFRLLTAFFGEDRVIPHMSIFAVCGGEVPLAVSDEWNRELNGSEPSGALHWAKQNKCLFTIVDTDDQPKLVIEFVADFSGTVDLTELLKRRLIRTALQSAGVNYVTISALEYQEITLPGSSFTLSKLLQDKFEISDSHSTLE